MYFRICPDTFIREGHLTPLYWYTIEIMLLGMFGQRGIFISGCYLYVLYKFHVINIVIFLTWERMFEVC